MIATIEKTNLKKEEDKPYKPVRERERESIRRRYGGGEEHAEIWRRTGGEEYVRALVASNRLDFSLFLFFFLA